ncbi:hypothetical protein BMEGG_05646 [Priestia megaterium]
MKMKMNSLVISLLLLLWTVILYIEKQFIFLLMLWIGYIIIFFINYSWKSNTYY